MVFVLVRDKDATKPLARGESVIVISDVVAIYKECARVCVDHTGISTSYVEAMQASHASSPRSLGAEIRVPPVGPGDPRVSSPFLAPRCYFRFPNATENDSPQGGGQLPGAIAVPIAATSLRECGLDHLQNRYVAGLADPLLTISTP